MTAWRLYQDAHAPCQQHASLRQGTGAGFLSFSLSELFSFDSLAAAITYSSPNQRRLSGTYVSGVSHLSDVCGFCLCTAAVDYLAKNVSLSTQRRMKLGDHSAVLGLLQVETGQAY